MSAVKINRGEADFAFQCKRFMLPEPIQQFTFAKQLKRKFTADFCFEEYRLLIEINGGVWRFGGGAHSRPANIERDMEKAQYAALLGYTMVPFTPEQVAREYAIEWTMRILHQRGYRQQ